MSPQPSSLSPDIQRLRDDGYGVELRAGHLLVSVPYVNSQRKVVWGQLISTLELAGNQTTPPDIHVVFFRGEHVGDYPCDSSGQRLNDLIHQVGPVPLGGGIDATCGFSRRPQNAHNDYVDYHEKMSTYVGMLQAEAQIIDPAVSYRDHPPLTPLEDDSPFRYTDSATSRARIGAVVDRVRGQRVAIVGVGGTGSYILDAVAKTPVAEIHLYDGDVLLTHNAFRAPGAATLEQLNARPLKVDHHRDTYDAMHSGIVAHPAAVDETIVADLLTMDYVFVSMDPDQIKLAIFQALQSAGIPFVDTGMGIYQNQSSISGIVRTSASSSDQANPAWLNATLSVAGPVDDDYDQNIQIAELNMLNAAMAVIMWKKHFGYYVDFEHELSSEYTIDGNHLFNESAL